MGLSPFRSGSLTVALVLACGVAETTGQRPVPRELHPPAVASGHGARPPSIRAEVAGDGERITLSSTDCALTLLIDSERHIRITGLTTGAGHQLLAAPAACLSIISPEQTILSEGGTDGFAMAWQPVSDASRATVDSRVGSSEGTLDGSGLVVESWHSWQRFSWAEVEVRLRAPEPVTWRLRLYRDRPGIEQRFELPESWRVEGRALAQVLRIRPGFEPVMPANAFAQGFSSGRPNLAGRHRFEFTDESEHLVYAPELRAGLSGFVAGTGGEERFSGARIILLHHFSGVLADPGPVRVLVWPFDGAVELGFSRLRRFVREEYSCQGDKYNPFAWNQFWLWQGGPQPAGSEVVTADRLLDILPHVFALGCEEFHLDTGWQAAVGDWRFDPTRFPDGFAPLRELLREHGVRYHTWMNDGASDDPELVRALIDETDLCKLFIDRLATEHSIACLRQIRDQYPEFETFVHHSTSRSRTYPWGNLHFLGDINQVYFGEGQFWAWSNVLPADPDEPDANRRFFSTHSLRAGDLVTRVAAYQAHWVWPYNCIVPPHNGWAWFEHRPVDELASRLFTTIAARYDYQWGFDPRMLRAEVLTLFRDWTAFFKAARPYLQAYQHILDPPDGVRVDGAAHLLGDRGFLVLCNPGQESAAVDWREILWEPELGLDGGARVSISDWTEPMAPVQLTDLDVAAPEGGLVMAPLSYRVLGVNVDVDRFAALVRSARPRDDSPRD